MENANATMCVREYEYQVPYGVIEIENDSIASIVEKTYQEILCKCRIYVLSPNIFEYIPENEFWYANTFNILIEKKKKFYLFLFMNIG